MRILTKRYHNLTGGYCNITIEDTRYTDGEARSYVTVVFAVADNESMNLLRFDDLRDIERFIDHLR